MDEMTNEADISDEANGEFDEGGVPFDDDFDDDEEDGSGGAESQTRSRGSGPAHDSGKQLAARGIAYPSATPAGMLQLKSYVIKRWGGGNLGILSNPPRTVRAGRSPSLHNWGMAWDWRWGDPGPGRGVADRVIEFCLDNSGVLGIQAVHDYEQNRTWKSYRGAWKTATPSGKTGMGQSWAKWLHIERTWAAANDDRAIEAAVGGGPVAAAPTGQAGDSSTGTIEVPDPMIVKGDRGANVARLQDFLRHFDFASFSKSDGIFGPKTFAAVEAAQRDLAGRGWYLDEVDGRYGPNSAKAAARLLKAGA